MKKALVLLCTAAIIFSLSPLSMLRAADPVVTPDPVVTSLETTPEVTTAPATETTTVPITVTTPTPVATSQTTAAPTPTTQPTAVPTSVPIPTPTQATFNGPVLNLDIETDLNKVYMPGEAFELKIRVKNLLDKNIKDMFIELKLDDKSAFTLDPQFTAPPEKAMPEEKQKFIPESLSKKESFRDLEEKAIVFKLITKPDVSDLSTTIPLIMRFAPQPSGNDPVGCPLITGYEMRSTIQLKAAMPEPSISPTPSDLGGGGYFSSGGDFSSGTGSGSNAMKNKPKLIITKYSIDPKMAKAGQEFTLNMTFFNTNQDKSCRNIKILLSTDIPAPSTSGGAGSADSSNSALNIFTPVNSSNTFYISKIDAEQTAEKTITFAVGPTVQSKNYTLLVKFEYEDVDGNQLEANEVIGIPVVQEAKIEADEVKVPDGSTVGQPINLDYSVYNVGKDNLTNLMIEYVGPMKADPARSFVGNFASGASSMFSTSLTPEQEGAIDGSIKISFEDSTGEKHIIEKPFTVQVMGMPEFDPSTMPGYDPNFNGDPQANAQPFYMNPLVWAGAGALLLIIITTAILRRRKAKKLEKDLTIDE